LEKAIVGEALVDAWFLNEVIKGWNSGEPGFG
jgi:hypothetical protein